MANLDRIIQQLRDERDRVDAVIVALTSFSRTTRAARRAGRRRLSPAARRRIAHAQRARWQRVRAGAKTKTAPAGKPDFTVGGISRRKVLPESEFIGTRKVGFLFKTRSGGPLSQRNVLRMLHGVLDRVHMPKLGFHAFRRFRVTHLRKNMVPEDLIKFWIGHAPQTVTDVYSKVKTDVKFRRETAEKVGLGFKSLARCSQVFTTSQRTFPCKSYKIKPRALSSVG